MKRTLFYPLLMTTMIAGLSGCKEQDGVSLQYEKYTLDNGLEVESRHRLIIKDFRRASVRQLMKRYAMVFHRRILF